MKHIYLFLLFLALTFNSELDCQNWLTDFEKLWNSTDPNWHYAFPAPLKDGRWYVPIIDSALPKLTEAERSQLVELTEADLPDPPPMPE